MTLIQFIQYIDNAVEATSYYSNNGRCVHTGYTGDVNKTIADAYRQAKKFVELTKDE